MSRPYLRFSLRSVRSSRSAAVVLAHVLVLGAVRLDAQTVSAGGANVAAIQGTVDAFRSSLGTLNANVAGTFGSGRREINWDGVPDSFSAPTNLPGNFFNANSPRGVGLSTPGTGLAVSAKSGVGPVDFGNIDPSYTNTFEPFSAQRLFTALGSNIVDVNFFIAGSSTAAFTRAFGVIFSDVDLASTTSLQFFDGANTSLGTFFAPTGAFSFLGVTFGSSVVSRVRITSGNTALAADVNDAGNSDLVVMDDFIYAETVVPEPGTYSLMAAGLLAVAFARRRRQR
ncbi:PEP-CTERM sorting domain-containing protein [Gemmatimonas sp.]|uniref:PEP-CTERM sorting domain-containing protein n=1 Tax=Gemmatimonas sp. TaxID=1962908 RepID=UPI00286B7FCB|nr:PEP-CTERM sorting domain-containing protein [Gemmatimonas sp.]